jgi:hypothetical protein
VKIADACCLLDPEDGGSTVLRKLFIYLPDESVTSLEIITLTAVTTWNLAEAGNV